MAASMVLHPLCPLGLVGEVCTFVCVCVRECVCVCVRSTNVSMLLRLVGLACVGRSYNLTEIGADIKDIDSDIERKD